MKNSEAGECEWSVLGAAILYRHYFTSDSMNASLSPCKFFT